MKMLLVLAAALLGGLLVLQWKDWPPGPSQMAPNGTAPAAATDTSATELNPLAQLAPLDAKETYASISEHTLFRPQRKPQEPAAAEPSGESDTAEAGTLEGLDLNAVVMAPGTIQAWVSDPTQGLQRLRPGELYQGWAVKEITPDTLVLERQGKSNTLVLRDFSQASPPAAAAPAPMRQTPAGQRGPKPAQGAQGPRSDRRVAPPRSTPASQQASPSVSPQARPNVPRTSPQRPE
jgi:hypothetical protein